MNVNPIDQQIMEQVFGWKSEKVFTDFGRDVFEWYEYKDGKRYNVTHKATSFSPTENLKDAWKVIEALDVHNVQIKRFKDGRVRCYIDFPNSDYGTGLAISAPYAISCAIIHYLDKHYVGKE